MKTKLVLFLVVFSFVFGGLKAQVNVGDSLALVDLYNSTGGAGWTNHTNWLTKMPVSTWHGILVNNKRVTDIYLQYNNLLGAIPASIGNLSELRNLALYHNSIAKRIPLAIGDLIHLQTLDLSYNKFSGSIPSSITELKELNQLTLHVNRLSGSIPAELGNLTRLENFTLQSNQVSGPIPKSIGNMNRLSYLDLSFNQLTGDIPGSLAKDTLLVFLFLQKNELSGLLPSSLGKLKRLQYFDVQQNQLTGDIPASYGGLKRLFDFRVSDNQLTGEIPISLQKIDNLNYLIAYSNHLTENNNGDRNYYSYISVDIRNNDFTFNGLEFLVSHIPNSSYTQQAPIAIHVHEDLLAVSAGGTLSNNTYNWFEVGQLQSVTITGDSTFQPTKSGSYYAKVTNSIVKGLTLKTDTVTYTMPLVKNELKISLSPNPARGMISIYGLDEKSDAKVAIADMSGYVWMSAMSREKTSLQVNVSRLKAGNYLVTVNDGKVVKTVMFVKE